MVSILGLTLLTQTVLAQTSPDAELAVADGFFSPATTSKDDTATAWTQFDHMQCWGTIFFVIASIGVIHGPDEDMVEKEEDDAPLQAKIMWVVFVVLAAICWIVAVIGIIESISDSSLAG